MSSVAIIGAGEIGGAFAYAAARRGRFDEILLLDERPGPATGKALDILQSGAIERSDSQLRGGGYDLLRGKMDLIVVADPGTSESEPTDDLLRDIVGAACSAVVVFAGARHRAPMLRAITEYGLAPARCVGSAVAAHASAIRALVAVELDRSPRDVHLPVLGVPPRDLVLAWSQGTLGGHRLEESLTPTEIGRLTAKASQLWPPGPQALASAACRVAEAVVEGARSAFTCLTAVPGEFVGRPQVAAAPVLLGPSGVRLVLEPPLSPGERVALDNALRAPRQGRQG